MRRVPISSVARDVRAAAAAAGEGEIQYATRIVRLEARVTYPADLAHGWDPDLYDWVLIYSRRERIARRLRMLASGRRRLAPITAPLTITATAGHVRISLNGQRADTSKLNDRNQK